ncbi:hypothetical protein BaRGS_00010516 [Batillaria attramentaria]|uniref:Uncharacterized protein n=1 Tax=Batillaria attramentaria TaxID=370345 RepID=A0ABD0LGD7_9CAEN|nr:hypothetical protein BaRGS_001110 [Batillaria attramentaria]
MAACSDNKSKFAANRAEGLECTLCLEIYKSPKILPCFHTFCEQCLHNLAAEHPAGNFPCPNCRSPTVVPPGGVSAFQNNFYIDPVDLRRAQEGSICAAHPKLELDWFCVDCDEVMCVKCAMTNHKLHETEDLSARVALVKTQLSDENARLQRRISQVKETASLITVDQQLAKDKQTVLEETVRNRQAALKALVDKFADDAVASLKEVTNDIRKANLNPLQESIKELTTSQQLLQQALNNDVDSELVALAKELKCKDKGEESARSLPTDKMTTVCRPVLRFSRADSKDVFEVLRDYLGRATTSEMAVAEPEVVVTERFQCGQHPDTEVLCVCPLDNGSVWVSYEPGHSPESQRSQLFNENGEVVADAENEAGRGIWTGRANEYGVVLKSDGTDMSSFSKSHTVYRLTSSRGASGLSRVTVLSEHPFTTQTIPVFTIACNTHRAFDVSRSEKLFVVVEEGQAPTLQREVRLYKYGKPDAIATYSSPVTPFRPSDVCFYNLGGQEVLLVADELNDAIHVVKTTSRSFEFDRYLAPGCPLLVRPTALNVDNKGRLWVACRGARVLTCQSIA